MNLEEFQQRLREERKSSHFEGYDFASAAFEEYPELSVEVLDTTTASLDVLRTLVAHIAVLKSPKAAWKALNMSEIRKKRDQSGEAVREAAVKSHSEVAVKVFETPELRELEFAKLQEGSMRSSMAHLVVEHYPDLLGVQAMEVPAIYKMSDSKGWTVAHQAVLKSNQAARVAMGSKEILQLATLEGYTVAHAAAEGHSEIAQELLDRPHLLRMTEDESNWSVAHEAAEHFVSALQIVDTPSCDNWLEPMDTPPFM